MATKPSSVNADGKMNNTTAPLKNVALFSTLLERVVNRPVHLPGMASFHGWSGYGKTMAAIYAANVHRAFYVEVGESWTKKKFCQAVLTELGLSIKGTIPDLVERVIEGLVRAGRPLIIDEFDHVVAKGYYETVREIHDKSKTPIILIGEERLPDKLKLASERFHNRMLDWVPAEPGDFEDTRLLARLYCPGIEIADDLLRDIDNASDGRVRRICVNIERVREFAAAQGLISVTREDWGSKELFKGEVPTRRKR